MAKQLTLGLFGFGCVGKGLYDVLNLTSTIDARIKTICVKDRSKARPIDSRYFTFDRDAILNDSEINVVVELIDDAEAAFEIVSQALRNGKDVVSANKKMIATHFQELVAIQRATGRSLLYEGAVCGAIPIIRTLEEYYDNDLLNSLEGIFNGSTNYILTQVCEKGIPYSEALAQAQAAGFAESDPRLDVLGYDPKFKLVIAIAHAYGLLVKPEEILNFGISRLGSEDIAYAREKGLRIKLLARSIRKGSMLHAGVLPGFVQEDHALYPVQEVYNGVLVQAGFSERQAFIGKGAGAFPTASAVLSDISALRYHYAYEYRKIAHQPDLHLATDSLLPVYVRYRKAIQLQQITLLETYEALRNRAYGYVTGLVSISDLRENPVFQDPDVFVALLPEGPIAVTQEQISVPVLEVAG